MEILNQEMNNEILDYYTISGGFKPAVYRFHNDSYSKEFKDFNAAVYGQLTSGRYKNLFDPVKFLDYLYITYEQRNRFKNKDFETTAHINQYDFTKKQRSFFVTALNEVISINDNLHLNLQPDKNIALSNSQSLEMVKTPADVQESVSKRENTVEGESGMNLKSQFLDESQYRTVIDKLVANGNLRMTKSSKLVFVKAHRAGIKYGVEALRQVFDTMGLLKRQSLLTETQLIEIYRNTFKDFNVDGRTLRNTNGIGIAYNYFKDLLS